MDRRRFLSRTAATGAATSLFPSITTGAPEAKRKLRHASIGAGGKAWVDLSSTHRTGGAEIVAIADVDENALAKAAKAFPNARLYRDWRELFDTEKELDSANISTPDHMHAICALQAMEKGLDLYVQKPLTHTVAEARALREMATSKGTVTQMGIQHSSGLYNRITEQWLADGHIGKVEEIHLWSDKTEWGSPSPRPERASDPVPDQLDWDGWLGVATDRPYLKGEYHPKVWRGTREFGTSNLGDMGCHIFSCAYRGLGLGAPLEIWSDGPEHNDFHWNPSASVHWIFPGTELCAGDKLPVHWTHGHLQPDKKIKTLLADSDEKFPKQACVFIGTEGILATPHVGGRPFLLPKAKFADVKAPKLDGRNHYGEWVDKVLARDPEVSAGFEHGGPLTEAILLGVIASQFPGERLHWDADSFTFADHQAATAALARTAYRSGWELGG